MSLGSFILLGESFPPGPSPKRLGHTPICGDTPQRPGKTLNLLHFFEILQYSLLSFIEKTSLKDIVYGLIYAKTCLISKRNHFLPR